MPSTFVRMRKHFAWLAALLFVACSGSSATDPTSSSSGSGSSSGGSSGSLDGGGGGDSSVPSGPYKSYVTLGDSISDRGGVAPFFYDLLAANDDATWPDYGGKDFKSVYGADFKVYKHAVSGSVSSGLLKQIEGIPEGVVPPVVVTLTIGGNDLRAAILRVLQGQDGPDRDAFRANLTAAFAALKKKLPGARVFQATIYDPSDGTGDFSRCGQPLSLIPKQDTKPFFAAWNKVATEVAAAEGVTMVDAYTAFNGHGVVPTAENWFAADCIHPSRIGHNEMRKLFFPKITGR